MHAVAGGRRRVDFVGHVGGTFLVVTRAARAEPVVRETVAGFRRHPEHLLRTSNGHVRGSIAMGCRVSFRSPAWRRGGRGPPEQWCDRTPRTLAADAKAGEQQGAGTISSTLCSGRVRPPAPGPGPRPWRGPSTVHFRWPLPGLTVEDRTTRWPHTARRGATARRDASSVATRRAGGLGSPRLSAQTELPSGRHEVRHLEFVGNAAYSTRRSQTRS